MAYDDVTMQMEKIVTARTDLLVDYIGKFINQPLARNISQNDVPASRRVNSSDAQKECVKAPMEVEDCIPYISYLDNKQYQLSGMDEVLDIITNYFVPAKEKCKSVLSIERCKRLIVSSLLESAY